MVKTLARGGSHNGVPSAIRSRRNRDRGAVSRHVVECLWSVGPRHIVEILGVIGVRVGRHRIEDPVAGFSCESDKLLQPSPRARAPERTKERLALQMPPYRGSANWVI